MSDPRLFDEAARLAALRRYNVLDSAPEEPFDKITSLVRTVLGVPYAAVTLIDQDRMWLKSNQGLDGLVESPRESTFCTHTIQAREPMVIPDARLDSRFRDNPAVLGGMILSYAGVPLASPDGYNVGALCVFDAQPREYAPAHMDLLKNFGALVVDELELRTIAQRDHLTGALTRRGFLDAAEKEIERQKRYGRPSTLVMFDIDHFKSINDRFGHPGGDKILRSVTQRCRDTMRPNDVLGRLGGEEFALLLPEIEGPDAMHAAERFRRKIEEPTLSLDSPIRVTASFGVAPLDKGIDTPEEWLARADVSLYDAKRGGRNRCCVANAAHVTQLA